ncbi:MAG: hypothetical protein ABW212_05100, partial [Pseudonocardia sediminis]
MTQHSAPDARAAGDLEDHDPADDLVVVDPVDDDPDSPPRRAWRRRTAIEMVVSGVLGLYTSFVLSVEAWHLAAVQQATFSCDLSSVIYCGTGARTW